MKPENLAECINTANGPGQLVGTCREGEITLLEYDERPNVYKEETEALLKRGYYISGITEDSDGTFNLYLREL